MTSTELRPAPPAPLSVTRRRPFLGMWWLSPIGAVSLVVPASLLGAWFIGDARYRTEWRTPKVLTGSFTVLMLLGFVALVLGAAWWQLRPRRTWQGTWPVLGGGDRAVLYRAATWTFWATVAGYVALAGIGLARGVTPVDLLLALVTLSTGDALKDSFAPVAGLTTFTQVGIAHVVLAGVLLQRRTGGRTLTEADRRVRRRLLLVLVLAGLRAFLLSERLAVLELVVPLMAVLVLRLSTHRRAGARRAARVAPAVLLPVLVAAFGAFEYARSWQVYAAHGGTSFVDFVLVRFAGYYATAYNNAAIADGYSTFPGRLPYWVAEWFWTAPGVDQLGLYGRLSGGEATDSYANALFLQGNEEFNNPGGLGIPFVDLGPLGGLLFLFLLGLVAGGAWNSLRAGRPAGMLLYPVVLTGLFELPRYLYLCQGRVLPALVVLALVARRLHRGRPSPWPARLLGRLGGRSLSRPSLGRLARRVLPRGAA